MCPLSVKLKNAYEQEIQIECSECTISYREGPGKFFSKFSPFERELYNIGALRAWKVFFIFFIFRNILALFCVSY